MNIENYETFYWQTEEPHSDNLETMSVFLNEILTDEYEIILHDTTIAIIKNSKTGKEYEVHASGDGDFCSHKVEFCEFKEIEVKE